MDTQKSNVAISATENKGVVDKFNNKILATFALASAGLASNSAFALDASAIVSEIEGLEDPLTKIGVAVIGLVLIGYGFAKAKGMIK